MADIIPNETLLTFSTTQTIVGESFPINLFPDNWGQALRQNYLERGTASESFGSSISTIATGLYNVQVALQDAQEDITALQSAEGSLDTAVAANAAAIEVNTLAIAALEADVSALDVRLTAAEADIVDLSPLTGTVTPENNVTSNLSQTYFQVDGGITEIFFNPTVGSDTGWVQMT